MQSLIRFLRNSRGAIDLASIMVGVLVISIIAGVIAASVFLVIPWSQDRAAQASLVAASDAQSVSYVKNDGRFSKAVELVTDDWLTDDQPFTIWTNPQRTCFTAVISSATGTRFYVTDAGPEVKKYVGQDTGCSDAPVVGDGLPEGESGDGVVTLPETPATDPTTPPATTEPTNPPATDEPYFRLASVCTIDHDYNDAFPVSTTSEISIQTNQVIAAGTKFTLEASNPFDPARLSPYGFVDVYGVKLSGGWPYKDSQWPYEGTSFRVDSDVTGTGSRMITVTAQIDVEPNERGEHIFQMDVPVTGQAPMPLDADYTLSLRGPDVVTKVWVEMDSQYRDVVTPGAILNSATLTWRNDVCIGSSSFNGN